MYEFVRVELTSPCVAISIVLYKLSRDAETGAINRTSKRMLYIANGK